MCPADSVGLFPVSAERVGIYLVDLATGVLSQSVPSVDGWCHDLSCSARGDLLVTVSGDDAFVVETETGKLRVRVHRRRPLWQAAISPNGRLLATNDSGLLHAWNVAR